MVESAAVWSDVTRAPGVTAERPMRPRDGRAHFGIAQVDRRRLDRRLVCLHRGAGLLIGRLGVVVVLPG